MPVNNSNLKSKKEPEDILAEVDKPIKKKGKSIVAATTPSPLLNKEGIKGRSSSHRPFFIIGGVIAMIVFAGIAGYIMLSQKPAENNNIAKSNNNINADSQKSNNNAVSNTNVGLNVNSPTNSNSIASGSASKITNDTDGDGLTNEEEAKAGTDSKNPDTDGDGLSDREEVKVWKTNPLKADTDGDGYNDGEEIKTLNDPKVPGGKLLDLNRAIQQLNANK